MKSKRILTALLAGLLGLLPLTACGGETESQGDAAPYALHVSMPGRTETLDPVQTEWETVTYHLYENLLRWEDSGAGWGVLAPGQAETWTIETDYAGNATYTFTLREGLCWSDGKAVTAAEFAAAWQRLADPYNALPHRELLSAVSGYAEVQETGDTSKLAVSAADAQTLTVTLEGNPAWFLAEVCAGAYTMPLREDGSWGTVTNGAYTAAEFTPSLTHLTRSVTYYDTANIGPEELYFVPAGSPAADYEQLASGELDMVTALPDEIIQEADEAWLPEPVTAGYGVLLNPAAPPFDQTDIREAFRLVIDPASLELGAALRPAAGLVPYGVADYGEQTEDETGDFRAHSTERVTMPEAGEYEENCRLARRMLAQAGYPQGDGFPLVEYVYVDSAENAAVAQALRRMWQNQLGVAVAVRGLSQEAYDALVVPSVQPETTGDESTDGGDAAEAPEVFQLAGWAYSAAYDDAQALLSFWEGGNAVNPTGYANEAFDLVMEAARTAVDPDVRDAMLHDAEALLLKDGPVIPVYYSGGSYALAEKWSGLYRKPDGVYFLHHISAA